MQSLLQSAFLQALGYAIFNSLWQVALLWIIVMIVNNIFRLSSSGKYVTGVVAQLGAFVWFLFTLRFYYVQCSEVMASARSAGMIDNAYSFYEPAVTNFSSGLMYAIIKTEQLLPYLSIAYMCMLLFLAAKLSGAWLYTKKIRTQGLIKPDVDLKLFVKRTAGYLGIRKEVLLYFSALVKSPLTLGFTKPVILVPIASLNHLTTDQLEAILLHELAHIKRADYLINIILSIIEISLFFNPFTQLIGRLIKKERENSCDDWVLQFQYKPAMYAEALLRIACIQTQSPTSFAMQASGTKGELLPRVKRMLNQQEKTHHYRNHVFALLLITIMLSTVAWFNPGVSAKNIIPDKPVAENKKLMVEPFTANVDNPLYNIAYLITKPLQENIRAGIQQATEEAKAVTPEVNKIINNATPIAIESFSTAFNELNDDLPKAAEDVQKAIQEAKNELSTIRINGVKLTDSMAILGSIANLVQKELSKADLSSLKTTLDKSKLNIATEIKNAAAEVDEANIREALQQATEQLQSLKGQKDIIINSGFLKDLFIQKNEAPNQQQLKLLQDKRKKNTEKISREAPAAAASARLKVWSDMQRDDYSVQFETPEAAEWIPSVGYQAAADNYIHNVNYNTDTEFTAPASDSLEKDGGIVVIQYDPDNDKSHDKKITIRIISDKGCVKKYTFKVETSQ